MSIDRRKFLLGSAAVIAATALPFTARSARVGIVGFLPAVDDYVIAAGRVWP